MTLYTINGVVWDRPLLTCCTLVHINLCAGPFSHCLSNMPPSTANRFEKGWVSTASTAMYRRRSALPKVDSGWNLLRVDEGSVLMDEVIRSWTVSAHSDWWNGESWSARQWHKGQLGGMLTTTDDRHSHGNWPAMDNFTKNLSLHCPGTAFRLDNRLEKRKA